MKKKGVVFFFFKSFYNSSSLLGANQQIFKSFNLNVSNLDFRGIAQSWASVWFCLFGLYSLVTCAVLGVKQGRKALPVIIGDKKKDGEEKKLLWLKSDKVICHPDLNFVVINLLTHKFCYHFTISQDIMCIFHLSFRNDCIV